MNAYQKGIIVGKTLAALKPDLDKAELAFHAGCLFEITSLDTDNMDTRSHFFLGVGEGWASEKSQISPKADFITTIDHLLGHETH